MTKMTIAAGTLLVAGMMGIGAGRAWSGQEEGRAAPPPGRSGPARQESRADRLRSILEEFRDQEAAADLAARAAQTNEDRAAAFQLRPDTIAFTGRVLALAEARPGDAVAGDAAAWIVGQTLHHDDLGGWGAQVRRAMELLLAHHADEPKMGQLCLLMDGFTSPNRDAFLERLRDRTKNREVRGLATYGLARYLATAARQSEQIRAGGTVPITSMAGGGRVEPDAQGQEESRKEFVAYFREIRDRDPEVLRARAIALLEEVAADYADLRDTRRTCRNPAADDPARARTLGEAASEGLAELRDLIVGKPAPEIGGTSVAGAPIQLSDYRGKVVLMVFWASWCGPCMREIPGERELARRMEGRPFTILGVNVDETPEEARKVIAAERISWPNLFDGNPGTGKVAARYAVTTFPTLYVLDADGVIRGKGHLEPAARDELVETLVREQEARTAGEPRR